MERVQTLISNKYFRASKYPSSKGEAPLLYSQGQNIALVQASRPTPMGHSNPLRVFVSVKPKSTDNRLRMNEHEAKIKTLLELCVDREYYRGAQLKVHVTLLQEGQPDVFSCLFNGVVMGLLKTGVRMKSTFFAFELFLGKGNEIFVFNGKRESIRNQVILVLDVVNNLVGRCFASFIGSFYGVV